MHTKMSSRYTIKKNSGLLKVVDDNENELKLDQEAQRLVTDLMAKLDTTEEEPQIVKMLKKVGFKFGKNKSTGWKPEDRNHI